VSVNRYERKKNVGLSLDAFAITKRQAPTCRLLIGGGYDPRLAENIEYYQELIDHAKELGFTVTEANEDEDIGESYGDVVFMRNLSDLGVEAAYQHAVATLYTPENEHFGIIPIDSMLRGTPVIACNSGGPLESIENGVSGYLLDQVPQLWADAMITLANDPSAREKMSYDGV
jgi:alpha-1,3/alpha-1,6-mannosyltransferase